MIEIHLDGKPVTKLQAARALAARNGMSVNIGIPAGEARVIGVPDIRLFSTVRGEFRQSASWPSGGAESGAGMRFYAGMFALAAEVAELAEMFATEQEAADKPKPVTWQCTYCWTEYEAMPSEQPPVCPVGGPLHGPGARDAQPRIKPEPESAAVTPECKPAPAGA